MTLADSLLRTAARLPDKPALIAADGAGARSTVSYGELASRVRAVAAGLRLLGLAPHRGAHDRHHPDPTAAAGALADDAGDRVAIMLPNGPAMVEAVYGAWAAGLVAVPLGPGLTATETAAALADAAVAAVVVDHAVADTVAAAREHVREQDPEQAQRLEHVIAVDPHEPLAAALGEGTLGPSPGEGEDEATLALLQYTAGTTGQPKGAMLTHAQLLANHRQLGGTRLEITERDVVLAALPLHHIYGLNVALALSLARGATVVLLERFDADAVLGLVASERVSVLPGAPPMYVALHDREDLEDHDLASLRFAVSGAAPLAPPVLERFTERTGVPLYEGYGLTETAPVLTSTAVAGEVRPGSVGHPLPEVELRLRGDDGGEGDPREPGEVWARGPNVFAGYWRDRAATAAVLDREGWLATGDIGYLDEVGLHLVDRKHDLIIVSGFNVYPREVEDVLMDHPGVAAAAAVGVPNAETGEAVRAFVEPLGEEPPDVDELHDHCAQRLARFKRPVSIGVLEQLPAGPTGKIRRQKLRDL